MASLVGKNMNNEPIIPIKITREPIPLRLKKKLENEEKNRRLYGEVKDIIHEDFQGKKVIAVGNKLMSSKNWKTFPDFLFDYIREVLGSNWGEEELKKPLSERHQIIQWYQYVLESRLKQKPNEAGLYEAMPDRITSAFLLLAYDLYLLSHNSQLQSKVIQRLKQPSQFQGARYELFVASTLIRAGCDLIFEDESDSTTKHVEFTAIHRPTKQRIAVEAKSKHRDKILGFESKNLPVDETKVNVRGLIENAVKKAPSDPLVIFVELNLPPIQNINNLPWQNDIRSDINAVTQKRNGIPPFDLLIFSNIPHHYGKPNEKDPLKLFWIVEPISPKASRVLCDVINAIQIATKQYGSVPNDFPEY